MNGVTRIDVAEMLKRASDRKLGTGTLARAVGLTNDQLQRLIALKEGPSDMVERVVSFLGMGTTRRQAPEPKEPDQEPDEGPEEDLSQMTAFDLLSAVEEGRISKDAALKAERAREKPRSTVLKALTT